MDVPSTHFSSSGPASGLVSSPFVPCTEDSAHTRRVGRHLTVFQRTLDAVSYRYLIASSRLARTVASSSCSHDAGSLLLPDMVTADPTQTAYLSMLRENYQQLWQQRGLVPKAARREWFETVGIHLKALNALEVTLAWLTDAPTAVVAVEASAAGNNCMGDGGIAAGDTGPRSSLGSPALYNEDCTPRKGHRLSKSAHDQPPLWCLWQDAQRHLHHMTLRLRSWTPAAAGAHGTREAMRMSDLVRMDSTAFAWRVRQWCSIAVAFHSVHSSDTGTASKAAAPLSLKMIAERAHPGMVKEVVRRLSSDDNSSQTTASLFPGSFAAEEPEVARILLLCLGAVPTPAVKVFASRQHVAGALMYRMLLEVTLGRLRALPRCIFTWHLLRDVLRDYLIALVAGSLPAHKKQRAVLLAMAAYVEGVLIPYLEHRDCHLESLRHTATQVHMHFTRISSVKIEQLHAAIVSADVRNGYNASADAQPEAEETEGSQGDQGGVPEVQRQHMATLMEVFLRRVCAIGAADIEKAQTHSLSNSDTTVESHSQCTKDIIASTILGETAAMNEIEYHGVGDVHQCSVPTTSSWAREDALFSIRRDFHGKFVDDSILHSSAARISQLRFFLYHYFTQSPSRAFDRVCRVLDLVATTHAEVGAEGGTGIS